MRWISSDSDAPAKFRELKQFAIDTGDNRSTLNFRAEEIRSSRWVTDWPWHLRFWFGYLYGLLSSFGRSILRPLFLWVLLTLIFSSVYLSAHLDHSDHIARYALSEKGGLITQLDFTSRAWRDGLPCTKGKNTTFIGLQPEVRQGTDAYIEAFRMSLYNAFVVGNMGGVESTRLTYGCLFGLARPSNASMTATTYVPPGVLWAICLQRTFSAVLIFLFAIGLRNTLR